jgi:hypothetical protein
VRSVERCVYAYNDGLSRAVCKQDKKVRLHWSDSWDSAEAGDWSLWKTGDFDLIVGCRTTDGRKNFTQLVANAKVSLNDLILPSYACRVTPPPNGEINLPLFHKKCRNRSKIRYAKYSFC